MVKSRKISILLAVAMLVSIMIPTTAFAGPTKAPTKDGTSYKDLFLELYGKIKDPKNGYFSPDEEFLITQLKH